MQPHPEDRPIAALLAPDILTMLEESPGDIAAETEELHPADLADVAELLPPERVPALLAALPRPRAADVLEYLDEELRTRVIEAMSARDAAEIVGQMTPDDRADTLEELDEDRAEEILAEIPEKTRRETKELLLFDPDTAGGIMTTEFVSVAADMTVEDALEGVRTIARSGRREAMYAIYVLDSSGKLEGVLSLRELLAAPTGARMGDMAWSEVRSVTPRADREAVARICADYDLVAVPVVSESGHIMGVVTVDDVIDAIQAEQTEDVQKFGGMEALDEPYTQIGFWSMIRKRGGWLAVLFLGEMLATVATAHYAGELEKAVILTIMMPLIISSGGNSGSQATSLIIRAMALGEVTLADWWRVIKREIPAGLTLGTILGAIGFARIHLFAYMAWGCTSSVTNEVTGLVTTKQTGLCEYPSLIGLTMWVSVIGVVTFGTIAGSMLPFLLRRLKLDPRGDSPPLTAPAPLRGVKDAARPACFTGREPPATVHSPTPRP
jgi:magnesium transporter